MNVIPNESAAPSTGESVAVLTADAPNIRSVTRNSSPVLLQVALRISGILALAQKHDTIYIIPRPDTSLRHNRRACSEAHSSAGGSPR